MTVNMTENSSKRQADKPSAKKIAGNNATGSSKKVVPTELPATDEKKIVRRKNGVQRRSQILEAVRDLIFTEGFSNFTIREVASRVGISEAAIYRHFISKEEMMLALLEGMFAPWREAIGRLTAEKMSFGKKLEELCQLHLHHLLDERLNPVLFFSEAINPQNQRLLELMRRNIGFLRENVILIVAAGQVNCEVKGSLPADAVAAAIIGLLQTSVIRWTLQRSADGLLEDGARNMAELARIVATSEASK